MANILIEKKLTSINQDDKKISIALMSSYVILIIQYLILISFNLLESSTGSNVQLLSKCLVGLTFIYALPSVLRRCKTKFIGVYFIAIFIFLLQYGTFGDNRVYIIDLLFPFFFMSLPAFVYVLSIKSFATFKEIMKKSSYIVFVVGLIIGILIFMGRASISSYSMSLSYYMLLPTLVFLDKLMESFSFKSFVFLILSLIIILSLGSRGPILCILFFVFLKFFSPHLKKSYTKAVINFILLAIGIIALIFSDDIIEFLYNLLLRFDINSRTLSLFLGEGVHFSGRNMLYEAVIAEIVKNPIIGIGIAGDRRIIGTYAHNIFIELIGNFGIIIGLIISIGIILLIIKSLLTKDKEKYDFVIMWISLGFIHLMVSGSYLIEMTFWIFFGVIIKLIKEKKIL